MKYFEKTASAMSIIKWHAVPAIAGAGIGAGIGALSDNKDRLRGAAIGAVAGGSSGALAGHKAGKLISKYLNKKDFMPLKYMNKGHYINPIEDYPSLERIKRKIEDIALHRKWAREI
jgi:hypothetical protein